MKRHLLKTLVALLAIAAAAAGPVRAQSHQKYTSGTVAVSALQEGDTLCAGVTINKDVTGTGVFAANRWKYGNPPVVKDGGAYFNVESCTILDGAAIAWSDGYATPVDENGNDGDAWIVTSKTGTDFVQLYLGGILLPAPPKYTVRMAEGTEEAANWTLASGNASVPGTQVLENVMSGSQVTATYIGTTKKVKSVKAVKYVAPVLVQSIVLDKQTAFLAKDSTMTLTASVLPENAADKSYTWSSDNTSVATVNATTGVVTGMAAGTANIIATANDGSGVKDTCVVTVLNSAILDGVTVLYASDSWSTVIGYNPGVLYQDDDDNVRLTSNGAFLYHDGTPVYVIENFYPGSDGYQWLLLADIDGSYFYYRQGETWQQAISANRHYNEMWSIEGGQVKNLMQTLVDSNYSPVVPTATIDPSTGNYHLWYFDN